MNANDMMKNWDGWAQNDAMWSVLTDPSKRGNAWDEGEFFLTGIDVISREMEILRGLKMAPPPDGLVLDFGCGLGRLTNALAGHVRCAHGVDISEEMVRRARSLARNPAAVEFFHNPREDLATFQGGAYALVYSDITLQHIPAPIQKRYIREFLRILAPGGIARFQTIRARGWRGYVPDALIEIYRRIKHRGRLFLPNYGVSQGSIERIAASGGGRIVLRRTFQPAGCNPHFVCDVYWIRKEGPVVGSGPEMERGSI